MNSRTRFPMSRAVLLLAMALLLTACSRDEPVKPQFDWQPPAFVATDADGNSFRYPEDLDGPTIVLFWASWCPYCKALMPHLQSVVDEYEGEIEVLALNFKEDEDPVAFLADRGFNFHLIPKAEEIASEWDIKATPGLFLVDAQGRAVFSNFAIPEEAYPSDPAELAAELKNYQKAARRAPFWAAMLRNAIDRTMM